MGRLDVEAENHATRNLQERSEGAWQSPILPTPYPDERGAFEGPCRRAPTSIEGQRDCESQEENAEPRERFDQETLRYLPASM
jgi:hypothetical protein